MNTRADTAIDQIRARIRARIRNRARARFAAVLVLLALTGGAITTLVR